MKNLNPPSHAKSSDLDLDDLLHPARAFAHPRDVVADADLTLNEKRAILASWASDACAVEAEPDYRCAADRRGTAWRRRHTRRLSIEGFRSLRRRADCDPGDALSH